MGCGGGWRASIILKNISLIWGKGVKLCWKRSSPTKFESEVRHHQPVRHFVVSRRLVRGFLCSISGFSPPHENLHLKIQFACMKTTWGSLSPRHSRLRESGHYREPSRPRLRADNNSSDSDSARSTKKKRNNAKKLGCTWCTRRSFSLLRNKEFIYLNALDQKRTCTEQTCGILLSSWVLRKALIGAIRIGIFHLKGMQKLLNMKTMHGCIVVGFSKYSPLFTSASTNNC